MNRFVHLTDIHFSDPSGNDPYIYTDTAARLDYATDVIARIDPPPDFVAITGDLTNRGDPPSYARLAQALERIEAPLILTLGNHDRRSAYRAQFQPDDTDPDAPVFHHARHGALHVIALDSLVPGRIGGAIGVAQFELLSAALAEHRDCRKLVLCHHPPHSGRPETQDWESLTADDSARLAELLAGHDVVGILSGHVHVDRVLHWNGVPVVVSTGLHNAISPIKDPDTVLEDAAGFAICDLLESGLDVTFVPLFPARTELGRIRAGAILSFE